MVDVRKRGQRQLGELRGGALLVVRQGHKRKRVSAIERVRCGCDRKAVVGLDGSTGGDLGYGRELCGVRFDLARG